MTEHYDTFSKLQRRIRYKINELNEFFMIGNNKDTIEIMKTISSDIVSECISFKTVNHILREEPELLLVNLENIYGYNNIKDSKSPSLYKYTEILLSQCLFNYSLTVLCELGVLKQDANGELKPE